MFIHTAVLNSSVVLTVHFFALVCKQKRFALEKMGEGGREMIKKYGSILEYYSKNT